MDVRNGETTSFSYDSWSSLGCLNEKLGDIGCIDMGILKDSTLSAAMMKAKRRRHRQPLLNIVESELQKQKQSRIETENDYCIVEGEKRLFSFEVPLQRNVGSD